MTPLRQRMFEDMQIRNLSPHTQRAYVENVARFARHFGPPPHSGQNNVKPAGADEHHARRFG